MISGDDAAVAEEPIDTISPTPTGKTLKSGETSLYRAGTDVSPA
jgi:hypothetical protein